MEPVFQEPPPASATVGPDARIYYTSQLLETMLQLPDGWHVASFDRRPDGVYVADVVMPGGPTAHSPLPLIARYVRCDGADGQHGLALDAIDLAS